MITNAGKIFFKNYLANQASQLAGAVSVGIGSITATQADARLQFEFLRAPVDIIALDSANSKLVFKGSLPEDISGVIYEVGLWTSDATLMNPSDTTMITTFDSETEPWTGTALFDTVTTRIGNDSLKHTPAASGTVTAELAGINLDLSENSSLDSFVFAYKNENTNVDSIIFRFFTDTSNYYQTTIPGPSVGYKFTTVTKGAMIAVGQPDWSDITSLTVSTVAKSTGAASVIYDGIRLEDNDTTNLDYGMIARYVLTEPVVKDAGKAYDFEYSLVINV